MAKVIFILQRRQDRTHDECMQHWSGSRHTSLLKQLPGLTKWIQNRVVGSPGEPACDGIGELWFEDDEVMKEALESPEMTAAVEDAKNFLDMERTGLVIVEERAVIG
jgi:uncharacterized protein (TIGR02118 family)